VPDGQESGPTPEHLPATLPASHHHIMAENRNPLLRRQPVLLRAAAQIVCLSKAPWKTTAFATTTNGGVPILDDICAIATEIHEYT
jgi:hypothetical protein